MAEQPYPLIVPNVTTGSQSAQGLNGVGQDGEISIHSISAIANVTSELTYFITGSIVYSVAEKQYYKYNGTTWDIVTDISTSTNTYTKTQSDLNFAPIGKGVTNGDSHDHLGGDGGTIAYSSLSGTPTLGTAASKDVPTVGNATSGQVVLGSDTRLTDSRTPTTHASTHVTGGSDVISNAVAGGASGLMTGSDKTKLDGISAGADVTVNAIHNATSKVTPVDADELGIADSEATYSIKKLTWQNLKATLKTYFDTLYITVSGFVHNSLSGLQGGTTGQYYHMTSAQNTVIGNTTGTNTGDVTVSDTTSVDFTLTGQQISAVVLPAGVDHNSLSNLTVGDPHTQYVEKAGDTMTGDLGFTSKGINTADYVNYKNTYTAIGTEPIGSTYWDTNNHTLSTVLENGVILQNGQEIHIYGKNVSGSIIHNGDAVSIVQASGQWTAFNLTDATNIGSATAFAGLATQDIAINAFGYVTMRGIVRDINTSLLTEGKAVYVNPSSTGHLTSTFPATPNFIINVGVVEYTHAVNGRINVIGAVVPKVTILSDVKGANFTTSGQLLVWDNTNKWFDATANISDFAPSNHDLLSGTHGDTLTDTVVRGDVIIGNSTPKWSRLSKGTANSVLQPNATDVAWSTGFLSITTAKTLTVNNTITLSAGADGYTLTIPATGTSVLGTGTTGQVTYWSGTNSTTGSDNFTVDASTSKITLGTDANLYRVSANQLKTDDSILVGVRLAIGTEGDITSTDRLFDIDSSLTAATSYGMFSSPSIGVASGTLYGFLTRPDVDSGIAASAIYGFSASTPVINAGGSVVDVYGGIIQSQSGGSGKNIGLQIVSPVAGSDTSVALWLSGTGGSVSGILFGTDTSFYRSAANTLTATGQSAFTLSAARQTTANTAGNNFTISASGSTSSATDKNGGTLTLQSGTSTGSGNSQFAIQTATPASTGIVTTVTLNAGGTGYTLGDVLTLTGGGNNGTITVDSVDGSGVILTFTLTSGGTSYALSNAYPTTGGTGTGAKFNVRVISGTGTNAVASRFSIGSNGSATHLLTLRDPIATQIGFNFLPTLSVPYSSSAQYRGVNINTVVGAATTSAIETYTGLIYAFYNETQVATSGLIATLYGQLNYAYFLRSTSAATTQATSVIGVRTIGYQRVSGASTATIGTLVGYDFTPAAAAGMSATNVIGYQMVNLTSSTATTLIGVDIPILSGGSGANIGIRIATPASGSTTNAAIQLSGTGGTAASGILFGTDVTLYRSAANVLKTDDSLIVASTATTAGRKQALATKSANYTLTVNDEVVIFTATATATLPAATGTGQTYRIICRAGTLTIDANASETIKGELTQVLFAGEDLIITDTASGIWE